MSGEVFISKESEKESDINEIIKPYKGEIEGLGTEVKNSDSVTYIENLFNSESSPKRIKKTFYMQSVATINFSNDEVKNAIVQIPEEKLSKVLFRASCLKKEFNLSDVEAIKSAYKDEDESSLSLNYETESDTRDINTLIYKAIDEGEDPFNGIAIPMDIVIADANITKNFKDGERVLYFDSLQEEMQKKLLNGIVQRYKRKFRSSVSDALEKDPNISFDLLFNNDDILKSCVGYYNAFQRLRHLYNKDEKYSPLIYGSLSENDRQELYKFYKGQLLEEGYEVEGVDDDILERIEETNRRIREENQRRFERWKKRNAEINNSDTRNDTKVKSQEYKENDSNLQNTSGADIAKNAGLGKQLTEQYKNDDKDEEDLQSNEQVFSLARSRFIENHDGLKSYITKEIMLDIYDENTNTIKNLDDKAWTGLKKIFQDHPDELKEIYNQLLAFPTEVTNTKNEISRNMKFAEDVKDEDRNNQTIGMIIDDVREIFKNDSSKELEGNLSNKGLKLKEQEPVKIEGDDLVISGEFNGADVIVRYNLKSGEIFMNSFVQYDDDNSKMIIGNNSIANYKIGQLVSFDNMIENYESLDSQVGILSDIIADSSKKQSATNSIIIKLMKTFNITQNEKDDRNIVLDGGSDLFDLLEIIRNTTKNENGLETVEKFQSFMEIIMDYACLKWGDNNLNGSQRGQGNVDYYDITFNEDNKDEYITSIRECALSFSKNPGIFERTENINSSYQLGFVNLIKKYITTDTNKPNWELDSSKIDDFIEHLRQNNKEQISTD